MLPIWRHISNDSTSMKKLQIRRKKSKIQKILSYFENEKNPKTHHFDSEIF
jgi:hypothetical protein